MRRSSSGIAGSSLRNSSPTNRDIGLLLLGEDRLGEGVLVLLVLMLSLLVVPSFWNSLRRFIGVVARGGDRCG